MTTLSPADYADTGQWRLLIRIYPYGISAHLVNTLHEDVEHLLMFEESWDIDEENYLKRIENAIYEHPRVLDDFSAKIIIYDKKTLFMPTYLLEEEEGSEEKYYSALYPGEPQDIMVDFDRDITVAYCPGKGVKSFLLRTFPGVVIISNLMDKIKTFRKDNEEISLIIEKRNTESDFILLKGRNLVSASTHFTQTSTDTLYHAFNLLDVYSIDSRDVKVEWYGNEADNEVKEILYNYTKGKAHTIERFSDVKSGEEMK